jgi:hypothetical protein
MARERFFQDLRRAWGLHHISPRVETIGSSPQVAVLSRSLQNLELWLSPKTVAEYRSEDFTDLDDSLRTELDRAVAEFLSVAQSVAPEAAVEDDPYHSARERFERLARMVQSIILSDWKSSVASVIQGASTWCKAIGWPDRLYEKELTEGFLGTYQVPQLLFQADGTLIELSPVARFVPGASGLIELRVVPSYDTLKMTRSVDGWRIHMNEGKDIDSVQVIPWNQPGFEKAVLWLRRQG